MHATFHAAAATETASFDMEAAACVVAAATQQIMGAAWPAFDEKYKP